MNDKQAGGVCSALLTNVSAWLSGTWFSLDLAGGTFQKVARALPFRHAVDAGRYAIAGNYAAVLPELNWVAGYAAVVLILAAGVFSRRMRE